MSKHLPELIKKVNEIKSKGWVKSTRSGNTGIGKTFEDLLNKVEDNLDSPDFHDIEIKTHEESSSSMLTLFTKSPSYPRAANTMLRNNYGITNENGQKTLHATVSGNSITKTSTYSFNFKVEAEEDVLRLYVYDLSGCLVNSDVFWSYDALNTQIKKKLKTIAVIYGEKSIQNCETYYKYSEIDIVTGLTIEGLKLAIKNGDLKVDLRIGVYNSGKNKGKTHDHGTGFRIMLSNLVKYANVKRL